MKTTMRHTFILLLLITTVCYFASKKYNITGFQLLQPGILPESENMPLLSSYKYTDKNCLSNQSFDNMWKEYPMGQESSYDQVTNNVKYVKNPDEGTCVPADFCNALYLNKQVPSNVIKPLPPAPLPTGKQVRINYYVTA